MATGNRAGSVGSHKPVPSWLNSSAWSRPPSSESVKKANPYGLSENGIKEQGKSKVRENNVSDTGGSRVEAVTDDPLSKQQHVQSSQATRIPPVPSSVEGGSSSSVSSEWPSQQSNTYSSSSSESGQPATKGSTSLNARIELFTIEVNVTIYICRRLFFSSVLSNAHSTRAT
jgi:hypothetical protein